MNKLKEIRSFEELKDLITQNTDKIKKAALPITVLAALLFFWLSGGSTGTSEIKETDTDQSIVPYEENATESEIYVDIGGCINKPGVYKIATGTRLFQVIEKAGGLSEDADTDSINMAEEVYDGQKIMIYSANGTGSEEQKYADASDDGKININRADSDELEKIPGVGPATAKKIIEYRTNNGNFSSIEEIKNVSGIGEKTYESMKEYITV
ncbi:MAG: helix-hairpin-helix domain-containing protein [Candidatus Fimisoma sp.]